MYASFNSVFQSLCKWSLVHVTSDLIQLFLSLCACTLHTQVFKASPIFGIEYSFESIPDQESHLPGQHLGAQEEEEILDSGHKSDAFALYCVGNSTVSSQVTQNSTEY